MRKRKKIFRVAFIVLIAYLLLHIFHLVPSLNLFHSQPVVIDETPILIKEIRSIGQLITYRSLDEVVVDSVAPTKGSAFVKAVNRITLVPLLPSADKQIVLIGKGKIMAGIDLSLLSDSSVRVNNDTVRLSLPPVKILDAIVNPSDFETFVEKGDWSGSEVTQVKIKARNKLIERAIQQKILDKAATKAKAIMEAFLLNMGYKKVDFL